MLSEQKSVDAPLSACPFLTATRLPADDHALRRRAFAQAAGIGWIVSLTLAGYLFGNIPLVRKNFSLVIFAIIIISILPALVEMLRQRRRA